LDDDGAPSEVGCEGKAWAFEQAKGAAWYYAQTNPAITRMGLRTIDRILADEPTA
jgi:hypothetical protein